MRPDGTPVPGAEVVIQSGPAALSPKAATDAEGARTTTSGRDGEFVFEHRRVGTYLLGAVHGDDVAPTTPVELTSELTDATLVLFAGAAVEVHVRSSKDRTPIAGATVRIVDGDRAFGEQWSFRTAQSDAAGIAKFKGIIATASHLIVASAPHYAETTLAIHDFQFSDRAWTVDMLLTPASQVSGRVLDSNGHGVANATVAWELGGRPRPAETPDLFDPFPFHGHAQAVQTDADGYFSIAAEPGAGCVLAAHPSHELGEVCGVTIDPGNDRSGLEIILRDGRYVSGKVVWPDGSPAAGATVIATKRGWIHQPMQSKSYRFEVRAGLDGKFEFRGIKRGELDLTAFTDDASSNLVAVDLTKHSDARDITITLSFEGTIRGRVIDEDKNPIGFAYVEYAIDPNMAPPDAQGKPRQRRRADTAAQHPDFALPRSIGATRADRDGNFEIHGLPDGLYTLTARRPDPVDLPTAFTSTTEQSVAAGETVELVLKGLGALKGRVVSEDGKPVAAFSVSLAPKRSNPKRDQFAVAHRIISADGTFALTSIPAGEYRVRVDGDDVTEQLVADAVKVSAGKVADAGTIHVVRGIRRHGIVLTKAKKPAVGARVTVALDPASEPFRLETDDDGKFTVPALPADQSLRVRADSFTATSDWVVVPATTNNIELVLDKDGLGSVSGVLVESGVALDRRSIVLTTVGEGTPDDKLVALRNTLTQEGGTFKFDSIPSGDYLIWVKRLSRAKPVEGTLWWKQDAPIRVEPQRETQVMLPVPPRDDGSASDAPQGGSGQGSGTGVK